MAEQPNISQILAALGERPKNISKKSEVLTDFYQAAQRPGGTPLQVQPPMQQQQAQHPHGYHPVYPTPTNSIQYPNATPLVAPVYNIPRPSHTGSLDLSNIKPVNSGSVSLADAISRARGIAAEKGVSYDSNRGNNSMCPLD